MVSPTACHVVTKLNGCKSDDDRDQTSLWSKNPYWSAMPSSGMRQRALPDARRPVHWMPDSRRPGESDRGGKGLLGALALRTGARGGTVMSTETTHPEDPFLPVAFDFLAEYRASIELLAAEGSMRSRICLLDYSGGRLNMVLPWEESERGRVLWALRVYILCMMPKAVIISLEDTIASRIETWAAVKGNVLGLRADYRFAPDFQLLKIHKDTRSLDDAPLIVHRIAPLTAPGQENTPDPGWISDALSILGIGGSWPTARYGGFGEGFETVIC